MFNLPRDSVRTPEPSAPPERVSPDRRRTQRQAAALANGRHPISLIVLRRVDLHPDAAPAGDRTAAGLRCGGCVHLVAVGHRSRAYSKCERASTSHSASSDIRAWWPACIHFEEGDRG